MQSYRSIVQFLVVPNNLTSLSPKSNCLFHCAISRVIDVKIFGPTMPPQVSFDINPPIIVRFHATVFSYPTSSIPSYEITLFDTESVFACIANWHPIQFENHSKQRMNLCLSCRQCTNTNSRYYCFLSRRPFSSSNSWFLKNASSMLIISSKIEKYTPVKKITDFFFATLVVTTTYYLSILNI